jgi:hypothetical protein
VKVKGKKENMHACMVQQLHSRLTNNAFDPNAINYFNCSATKFDKNGTATNLAGIQLQSG